MKYLKKYNENQEQQDPEFAIVKIKERYPEDMIQKMLEEERIDELMELEKLLVSILHK